MSAFEELGVAPELIRAVEEMGWALPTPIQAEAVPLILGGGDVMAAAETGSGKTGAFALPVIQIVYETLVNRFRGNDIAAPSTGKTDEGPTSACRLNVEDRDAVVAISPDGVTCQARSETSWGGCRATRGAFGGRVYYEATIKDEGLCRVGWAALNSSFDIGTDKFSFGFGSTGNKSHTKKFQKYGEKFGKNDVIGCWLDCTEGELGFNKNGVDLGIAYPIPTHLRGQPLFPAVSIKNAEIMLNFGCAPFANDPPKGTVGLASAKDDASVNFAQMQVAFASMDNPGGRTPLALILEPTRDLAEQTHDNIAAFSKHLSSPEIRQELLVGGTAASEQIKSLRSNGVDIVIGTPGRVCELVERGELTVDGVQFFILDEADRLLDTGNRTSMLQLFRKLPKCGEGTNRLQVLLFSATLHSQGVRNLAEKICQNPVLVDLKGRDAVPDTVDHAVVCVDPREDRTWLQSEPRVWTDGIHAPDPELGPTSSSPEAWSEAVKRLKPRVLQRLVDSLGMDQVMVFCRTNHDCDNLERFLNSLDSSTADGLERIEGVNKKRKREYSAYSCVVLAGARSMEDRRAALHAFREGEVRFLIATDVAARGIDIQGLPFVVNMTLPDRCEDYIHRVGRVGRAEANGLAVSMVSAVPEKVWYRSHKGQKPWLNPTKDNTALNDGGRAEGGGHAIWYDELDLLSKVEKRLDASVTHLPADFSLPKDIACRLGGQSGKQRSGKAPVDDDSMARGAEAGARAAAMKPTLTELTALEHQVQLSFFKMKKMFVC